MTTVAKPKSSLKHCSLACPHCGSCRIRTAVLAPDLTTYEYRGYRHLFHGPARDDFSWAGAVEE